MTRPEMPGVQALLAAALFAGSELPAIRDKVFGFNRAFPMPW